MATLTVAAASGDLLDELRRLVDRHGDADSLDELRQLTDDLTSVLRRTRGRIARLTKATPPKPDAEVVRNPVTNTREDGDREGSQQLRGDGSRIPAASRVAASDHRVAPPPIHAAGLATDATDAVTDSPRKDDRHGQPQPQVGRDDEGAGPRADRVAESPRPPAVPDLPPAREPVAVADRRPGVPAPNPTAHEKVSDSAARPRGRAAAAAAAVLTVLVTLWTPVADTTTRWVRRAVRRVRDGMQLTRRRLRRSRP